MTTLYESHHEPLQGADLRRALAQILDRPVTALPTPEQTLGAEARAANGRAAAAKLVKKHHARRALGRPPIDRQAVARDLAAGRSILEVTILHQISDTTAKKIRNEHGLPRGPMGATAGYDHEQALADLDQGMTTKQVAAKHGVHFQTINKLRRARRDQGG